jgi:hypothetical protein
MAIMVLNIQSVLALAKHSSQEPGRIPSSARSRGGAHFRKGRYENRVRLAKGVASPTPRPLARDVRESAPAYIGMPNDRVGTRDTMYFESLGLITTLGN